MDVLNKLKNTVSNTISNTVNNTAYGLSQLSSVLPGNPVTREFEVTAHIASGKFYSITYTRYTYILKN